MKTPQKITKKEADAVIAQVQALVGGALAKADPGQETSAEPTPEGSSTSPPPDQSSPAPDAGSDPGAGGPPSPDAPADAQPSPEQLMQEIEAMPPEDFEMWSQAFDAVKAKRDASAGPGPGADAGGGAPPLSDTPPPPMDASAGLPPEATKAEMKNPANGGMSKSEGDAIRKGFEDLKRILAARDNEIATLTTKVETMSKTEERFGEAARAMAEHVEKVGLRRKAVTGATVAGKPGEAVAKSEGKADISKLTRPEIKARLGAKLRTGALKKSDRDAVVAFDRNPSADPSTVAHLLIEQ
jgi:hypothetical protein